MQRLAVDTREGTVHSVIVEMAYREALLASTGGQDRILLTPSYRFIVYGLSEPSCNSVCSPQPITHVSPDNPLALSVSCPDIEGERHYIARAQEPSEVDVVLAPGCLSLGVGAPGHQPERQQHEHEETHYHWATSAACRRHALVPSLLPCASIVRFSATKRKARGVCLPTRGYGFLYSPNHREEFFSETPYKVAFYFTAVTVRRGTTSVDGVPTFPRISATRSSRKVDFQCMGFSENGQQPLLSVSCFFPARFSN